MFEKWFHKAPEGQFIALSSRVRLARNVEGLPFPGHMTEAQSRDLIAKCREAVEAVPALGAKIYESRDSAEFYPAMAESHLVSREFAASDAPRAVFLSEDESISLMVNEEDHLRLQVLGAGLCLEECLDAAGKADDALCERLHFSFDEHLGYLTHCPTNLGTGLRASVMLHLPALTECGGIRVLSDSAAKMGICIRGFFGEGSEAVGALYQVSNQVSLGMSESEIVRRVKDVVDQIIREETRLREEQLKSDRVGLEDKVFRAVGTLRYARRISSAEAMELLSDVRLGLSLGLTDALSATDLSELVREIMPAVIDPKGEMSPAGRDEARTKAIAKHFA